MSFSVPHYPALHVYQWFRVIAGTICFRLRRIGFSIFLGLIATSSAHADRPNYDVKSIRDLGQRSQNFYRSIDDLDPACKRIILSLNEKYTISEDKREPNTNRAGDVLLGSKLELPWRRDVLPPNSAS
jgi:hypothetical protein